MNTTVKHSVLSVRFSSASADCNDTNSQPVTPQDALSRLHDGDAWAVLAVSGHDTAELTTWLMRLRQQSGGRLPGVVAFLPDPASPSALAALRAGADAVLSLDSPGELIRAQLGRLHERVAPKPAGWLQLEPGLALEAEARRLHVGEHKIDFPQQLFRLLWALAARGEHVLSPQALRLAMDIPARAQADTVHTAVGKLRRALRTHGLHERLQTVHGFGYRWRLNPAATTAPHND